jgi:exodeoxyribonuclease-3
MSRKIRLATWNVNSARLRMPQIARFLREYEPDILCLQEIKCTNEQFPRKELRKAGYEHVALNGQKAYHGVAIISRLAPQSQENEIFGGVDEARHMAVEFAGLEHGGKPLCLHNFYVPAGGDEPDPDINPKFRHKLDFMADMKDWFGEGGAGRRGDKPLVLVGDLNIAPRENDVWSHRQLLKVVSHTPVEVEHMNEAMEAGGWLDVMRAHVPDEEKLYTWWSYRARDWRASNRGRRLDHIWLSPHLAATASRMEVIIEARGWERPSDHAPVMVELEL